MNYDSCTTMHFVRCHGNTNTDGDFYPSEHLLQVIASDSLYSYFIRENELSVIQLLFVWDCWKVSLKNQSRMKRFSKTHGKPFEGTQTSQLHCVNMCVSEIELLCMNSAQVCA